MHSLSLYAKISFSLLLMCMYAFFLCVMCTLMNVDVNAFSIVCQNFFLSIVCISLLLLFDVSCLKLPRNICILSCSVSFTGSIVDVFPLTVE